jgi:streptogramin lyase
VPFVANVGQKISAAGVVSTYSLVYTAAAAYIGGVLAPNGDIHFVSNNADRGQKVSASGVVSTYSLIHTAGDAYSGGVLSPNGDIYFVPSEAPRGQKISTNPGQPLGLGVCLSSFLNKF